MLKRLTLSHPLKHNNHVMKYNLDIGPLNESFI